MSSESSGGRRVAVLDDDPTGVQTLAGVRVLLDWTGNRVARALVAAHSVHLLTNSRALASQDARATVASAARAVTSTVPGAMIVLRGDSTLRGHILEEYLALREALARDDFPPLVLVPALPSAGRVTIGGVQYLERDDGVRIPVHSSEFARDGPFAYASSRVLEWAEERTGGLFGAENGIEVELETLRRTGPDALVEAIRRATTAPVPTAVCVDSERPSDIDVVAEGVHRAREACDVFIVRCGPALAGGLGYATALTDADLPSAGKVFVVCGSYVAQSVRQLACISSRFPEDVIEVDPLTLSSQDGGFPEITLRLQERLDISGLAVLAVSGPRPERLSDLPSGMRVAQGLATLVASVDRHDALVVLKGGVTSAVALKNGLGALEADIVGPVLPGVALWQIVEPDTRPVLVVPGNVGADELLVRIVELVRGDVP